MLLFFTLDAFCSRSIEERRSGEGEPKRSPYRLFSVLMLRLCQNIRGDVALSAGDDWNGEESVLTDIFCHAVSGCPRRGDGGYQPLLSGSS